MNIQSYGENIGFKDAYNLEGDKPWFSKECIGIDKKIEVLMIENYLNATIWKYFMQNKFVKESIKKLGILNKTTEQVKNMHIKI